MVIGTAANMKVPSTYIGGRSGDITVRPSSEIVYNSPGGGSGGTPDWVPANARIYIDFVNNRAWTASDGIVAVDTLVGSDPTIDSAWGATTALAPDRLTADGYVIGTSEGGSLALIGAARTAIVAACTVSIKTSDVDENGPVLTFAVVSATGNNALDIDWHQSGAIEAFSFTGPTDTTANNLNHQTPGAKNGVALTMSGARWEVAVNGADPFLVATLEDAEHPADDPFAGALFDGFQRTAIQYVTIYDALPDTVGLSALSA